jgi:hypothetical protein
VPEGSGTVEGVGSPPGIVEVVTAGGTVEGVGSPPGIVEVVTAGGTVEVVVHAGSAAVASEAGTVELVVAAAETVELVAAGDKVASALDGATAALFVVSRGATASAAGSDADVGAELVTSGVVRKLTAAPMSSLAESVALAEELGTAVVVIGARTVVLVVPIDEVTEGGLEEELAAWANASVPIRATTEASATAGHRLSMVRFMSVRRLD